MNANGCESWYMNGVLHRLEGPAVIHSDGSEEWWAFGQHLESPPPCPECGKPMVLTTTPPDSPSL